MFGKGRLLFTLASFLTVLLMVSATLTAASNRQEADGSGDSLYKNLSIFMEVFGLVNKAYVDEPETERLMGGALEGALDALDPFSQYIPAADVARFAEVRAVGRARSGMLILKEQGVAYVVAVDEGSPAQEAGLVSGDILSIIDGQSTRGLPLYLIQELLTAETGTVLEIERLRQGSKTMIDLTLGPYAQGGVELSSHKGVAVLRIAGFHENTYGDVEASLEALASGALPDPVETGKLVIDLRGVAGGDGEAAYKVAGLFSKGELGKLVGRAGDVRVFNADGEPAWKGETVSPVTYPVAVPDPEPETTDSDSGASDDAAAVDGASEDGAPDDAAAADGSSADGASEDGEGGEETETASGPEPSDLVLLVNRGTQGAAEILVAVLEQTLNAVLVGEGTFGHSGMQEIVTLSDGGEVHLTRAFYTGPDGRLLDTSRPADLRVRDRLLVEEEDETASVDGEASGESAADGAPAVAVDGDEADEDGEAQAEIPVDPVLERGVDFLLSEDSVEEEAAAA